MTTTYYLLRTKTGAVGNGPYLGSNGDGSEAIVTNSQEAHRFDTLESAEQHVVQLADNANEFEIEVRNTDT